MALTEGRLGIVAGSGTLPALLAEAEPDAMVVAFEGTELTLPEARVERHRVEKLGSLFKSLKAAGVSRVVMGGGWARPNINPLKADALMLRLAPRVMQAVKGGDDGILRLVISVFEEQGFSVVGAHEVLPALTAAPGLLAGPKPRAEAMSDIARARTILDALAPVDVGQGCVVADGLCLGIETLQGTDALLRFVGDTPARLRGQRKGVLVKRPKQGQDLRVDMPALGPRTVEAAASAGLEGIAIAAGQVLILDRAEVEAACTRHKLFLLAEQG
ncbi:LpxI family protein [Pseudooceanicola sp. C21-150M6]|uniref:LpxI family protein n=1 Tax=Pseudooceanicola sp. C21-150M6 TaxID=3434355 RepID=UPI003D7F55CA